MKITQKPRWRTPLKTESRTTRPTLPHINNRKKNIKGSNNSKSTIIKNNLPHKSKDFEENKKEECNEDSEVIINQEEVKKEKNIPSDIHKNIRKDYEANHKPNNTGELLANIPESNNKSKVNHEDKKSIADNNATVEVTANAVPIDHDSEAKNEASNGIQNFGIDSNKQELDNAPNSQKSQNKIDDENENDSRIEGFNKALCNDIFDEDD